MAVKAYIMWRLKDGIKISKDQLTYFSPGGYIFTHRSGKHVSFDFMESYGDYIEGDGILDFNHNEIDNNFILDKLVSSGNDELVKVKEDYDIDFFIGGKINLDCEEDKINCFMDLMRDEVDFNQYIEPVYMEIYDEYNIEKTAILLNKLTKEEYEKYYE